MSNTATAGVNNHETMGKYGGVWGSMGSMILVLSTLNNYILMSLNEPELLLGSLLSSLTIPENSSYCRDS